MKNGLMTLVVMDPRTVWRGEAKEFTPWLAEQDNIALVGEAVGNVRPRNNPLASFAPTSFVRTVAPDHASGIVSERDYARKVVLRGRYSKETQVRDIMTSNPITAAPEGTVDDCLKIMTYIRIRHLPVIEGLELVGIVSMGDLLIIADQADTMDELHRTLG